MLRTSALHAGGRPKRGPRLQFSCALAPGATITPYTLVKGSDVTPNFGSAAAEQALERAADLIGQGGVGRARSAGRSVWTAGRDQAHFRLPR